MKPALSSLRVPIVGSLLVLALLGLSSLFDSEPAMAAHGDSVDNESAHLQAAAELAAAEAQEARAALKPSVNEIEGEALGGEPVDSGPSETVWQLIAQLEVLAKAAESYHELALPVIEKIGPACAEATLAHEVFQEVVVNGRQPDLVRGAVLLGVSERIDDAAFESLFLNWFGASDVSPELLRSAAIAAAQRGEKSYCNLPVDLGYLAQLQDHGDRGGMRLPGIYPFRIGRIPSPAQLDVMRGWIEAAERTAGQMQDAPGDLDLVAIGEFFVTTEVLFAVWGHAGLHDAEVESAVMSRAIVTEVERGSEALVCLRVANFLVHSLAPCNDRMFDLSVQMATSEDPVLVVLANSMSGHLSAGIGVALLSKIEAVRYSEEPGSSAELAGYLLEIGDGLASIADPHDLEQALAYIDGIIQDPMVDALARSIGLKTLAEHAPWEAFLATAADAVQAGAPEEVHVIALSSLVERAGSDAGRRDQVIEVLEETRGMANDDWISSSLSSYIETLSQ